jgi:hypothetical protein
MKKSLSLFLLLCLPFLAPAQWSVRIFAGGGPAFEAAHEEKQIDNYRVEKSKVTDNGFGYSFQGGVNMQYFINRRFGFGTGLGYQYKYSDIITLPEDYAPYHKGKWHSESLIIPFNFLWSPGKRHHSVFNAGLATHINLMPYETYWGVYNDQYPVFVSAQLGYAYRLGKRFQMGLLMETDLGWYARTAAYTPDQTNAIIFANRSFTSAQIILSYRLFGKEGKNR